MIQTFLPALRNNIRSNIEFESLNNTNSFLPAVRNNVRSDNDLNFNERLTIGEHDFSQSITCIITRFRESRSTLLDKLWYLYSYIYN